ncbi:hypothetical protein [Rhodococcoides kyotonense]|nr:hypothetical protein [Rhodococcus kyotonensis]
MIIVAVVLLVAGATSATAFNTRLSILNRGHRLPWLSGRYPVAPPLRVRALAGAATGASLLGALIVSLHAEASGPLAAAAVSGIVTVVPLLLPHVAITFWHNKTTRAEAS